MPERMPEIVVESVERVYDDGNHNAFTDMIAFNGRYYLAFRSCPDGHLVFPTSRVKVLASDDLREWTEVFSYGIPGRDIRDPHLAVLGDTLFAYSGSWLIEDTPEVNHQLGYGISTQDGTGWEGPFELEGTYGHYVWRAVAHNGRVYLNGRRKKGYAVASDSADAAPLFQSALMESEDGRVFRHAGFFQEQYGDETAFQLEDDGSVIAVMRTFGPPPYHAVVCRSRPPYREWRRDSLHRFIGGPMLAKWGGRYLVGGRKFPDGRVSGMEGSRTALGWLTGLGPGETPRLVEGPELPSGGDTSYTGFIPLSDTEGVLSYYSSHEGSGDRTAPCHIYLARLRVVG